MLLKYLGHSAFCVQGEGVKLLIDPFLSGNPLAPVSEGHFTSVDYILVTHGHSDHIGDTVKIAKRTGATVICNHEVGHYLSGLGAKCHSMHIGGSYRFPFGKVKMTPALHGSDIDSGQALIPGGMPGGFLLDLYGVKLYHAGDTGLTLEMKLLRDERIDVALLPIGGNYTMDAEDAAKAVEMIEPKHAVPMHYNTFQVIKADPEAFEDLVRGKTDVIVMNPGDEREFQGQ